jgi:hypothetical protein
MSDVFELPIDESDAFAYGFNTIESAHKIGRCSSAQHAAHSINHIDALADALELILDDKAIFNIDSKSHAKAVSVLVDYRGEK